MMKTQISRLAKNIRYVIAASAAASVVSIAPVFAQETAIEDVEKIAVIGSRGAPRSISDSPVPIDFRW
jgi:iron complex outermembrane receptor protein